MSAAVSTSATVGTAVQRGGPRLSHLLIMVASLIFISIGAIYVVRMVQSHTFHEKHAFRVLRDVASQFNGLQESLTSLLTVLPEAAGRWPCEGTCLAAVEKYNRKLALNDVKLESLSLESSQFVQECRPHKTWNREVFLAYTAGTRAPFRVYRCPSIDKANRAVHSATVSRQDDEADCLQSLSASKGGADEGAPQRCRWPGLQGSMRSSVEGFVVQRFFDQVLIALPDGDIVAEIQRRDDEREGALQAAGADRLDVTDADWLIRRAGRYIEERNRKVAEKADEKNEAASAMPPAQPVVFPVEIAGQNYRVFVMSFRPAYPLRLRAGATNGATAGATQASSQPTANRQREQSMLYVIGLRRADVQSELTEVLGAQGRFVAISAVLLVLLAWPLFGLRSKPREEAISWGEIIACVFSVLLIPAVLTAIAVWTWSYQELLSWADRGARTYAQDIEQVLVHELQGSTMLLEQYRRSRYSNARLYDPPPSAGPGRGTYSGAASAPACKPSMRWSVIAPGRSEPAQFCMQRPPEKKVRPGDSAAQRSGDGPELRGPLLMRPFASGEVPWMPLRLLVALNAQGAADGAMLTIFDDPEITLTGLNDRPYFRALEQDRAWNIKAGDGLWTRPPDGGFVAQRIQSRSDAARVLQIALPRCVRTEFCGIVSGNQRAYGLSASVAPLFLRFAILDAQNGAVIFHSDDTRSLVENFLVETDGNGVLKAAMTAGRPAHFSGRYLGESHRFQYLPVHGVPWGVVVFYPTDAVSELPSQAALTGLTAYGGPAVLLVVILLTCFGAAGGARRRAWAARLWPRPAAQRRFTHPWLIVLVLAAACVTWLLSGLHAGVGWMLLVMLAVGVTLIVLAHRWTDWPALQRWRENVPKLIAQHYVTTLIGLVTVTSVIPVAWLTLGYHDAQLQGLVRDGLLTARRDIDSRRMRIQQDLQRWVAEPADRHRLPDAWYLAQRAEAGCVPGFRVSAAGAVADVSNERCAPDRSDGKGALWTMTVFDTPPFLRREISMGLWRSESWRASATSISQRRRIDLAENGVDTGVGKFTREGTAWWTPGVTRRELLEYDNGDGRPMQIVLPLNPPPHTAAEAEPQLAGFLPVSFEWISRNFVNLVAFLLVLATLVWLPRAAVRRFAGIEPWDAAASGGSDRMLLPNTFVMSINLSPEHRRLLCLADRGIRPQLSLPSASTATASEAQQHEPVPPSTAPVAIVRNFDADLFDPQRRLEALQGLEAKLQQEPDQPLLILSDVNPVELLQHPGEYPEWRAPNAMGMHESLRWDRVFARFNMEVVPAVQRSAIAAVDHHRIWKQSTRAQRMLLYQIARGYLANPRHGETLNELISAGLVVVDPWPRLADRGFASFILTAETADEFRQWQRDASRSGWKTIRNVLASVVLLMVLAGVAWFSWAAGDTLKVVSAVMVAALAFVGQISQALNLVRNGLGGAAAK